MKYLSLPDDKYVEDTTSKTTEAVIVSGVVISAGVITFVIVAMVVSHVVLKKKCGKKEQHQASPEHTYESIPLPTEVSHGIQQEPDRTTSIVDEDETVKYDDLVSCQNVQESCNDIPQMKPIPLLISQLNQAQTSDISCTSCKCRYSV